MVVLFFPAENPQEPILYKGERSAAALVEWVNEKLGIFSLSY